MTPLHAVRNEYARLTDEALARSMRHLPEWSGDASAPIDIDRFRFFLCDEAREHPQTSALVELLIDVLLARQAIRDIWKRHGFDAAWPVVTAKAGRAPSLSPRPETILRQIVGSGHQRIAARLAITRAKAELEPVLFARILAFQQALAGLGLAASGLSFEDHERITLSVHADGDLLFSGTIQRVAQVIVAYAANTREARAMTGNRPLARWTVTPVRPADFVGSDALLATHRVLAPDADTARMLQDARVAALAACGMILDVVAWHDAAVSARAA